MAFIRINPPPSAHIHSTYKNEIDPPLYHEGTAYNIQHLEGEEYLHNAMEDMVDYFEYEEEDDLAFPDRRSHASNTRETQELAEELAESQEEQALEDFEELKEADEKQKKIERAQREIVQHSRYIKEAEYRRAKMHKKKEEYFRKKMERSIGNQDYNDLVDTLVKRYTYR